LPLWIILGSHSVRRREPEPVPQPVAPVAISAPVEPETAARVEPPVEPAAEEQPKFVEARCWDYPYNGRYEMHMRLRAGPGCGNCRHWDQHTKTALGKCRRPAISPLSPPTCRSARRGNWKFKG
jgi:hypothetical protein